MVRHHRIVCLLGCAMMLLAVPARAKNVARYAVLIGSNHGDIDDPPLRHTQSDAHHLQNVLVTFGDFNADNVTLLEEPSAEGVRKAFAAVRDHISDKHAGGTNSLLFVYYSGHADSLTVHLNGTIMRWEELLGLSNQTGANTRVVVVDACHAGEVTQVKGIRLAKKSFFLPGTEHDVPQGLAVLASSTASETSQESERLEGSVFTHHFIAALEGAGDANGDGIVSLVEAFQYSSDRTALSTANAKAGVQHATYRYALRGRNDLALTYPASSENVFPLVFQDPGEYLLRYGAQDGPLAADVMFSEANRSVYLAPGLYYAVKRTPSVILQGKVNLGAGKPATLRDRDLVAMAMELNTPKGIDSTPPTDAPIPLPAKFSLSLWAQAQTPLIDRFTMPLAGALRLDVPLTDRWFLDLGAGSSYADHHGTNHSTALFTQDIVAGVRWLLPVSAFEISLALRGGALLLRETYTGLPAQAAATSVVPFGELAIRWALPLSETFYIAMETGARVVPLTLMDPTTGSQQHWQIQPRGELGVGWRW